MTGLWRRSLRWLVDRQRLRKHIDRAIEERVSVRLGDRAADPARKSEGPTLEELQDALDQHDRRVPLFIPLTGCLLLALVLWLLLTVKVGRMDVVLSLEATEVIVLPSEPVTLPRVPEVSRVHVGGVERVVFEGRSESVSDLDLRVEPAGFVALEPWTIAPDSAVRLQAGAGEEGWRARPAEESRELRLSTVGPVHIDRPPFGAFAPELPLPLTAIAGRGDVRVSWRREPDGPPLRFEPVTVRELRVLFDRPTRTGSRRVSGLLGGSLTLENLAGKRFDLAAGEALTLEGVDGELTRMHLESGKLSLHFVGSLTDARLGYRRQRSLRPSRLAVWLADPNLGMARTALLALFSGLAFLWAWLRR